MKKIILIYGLLVLILSGCSKKDEIKGQNNRSHVAKKNGIKLYRTKINKIIYRDGDFIIYGTSKAPNNSKIMVEALNSEETEDKSFKIGDENEWATVKGQKFVVGINVEDLSSEEIYKSGQVFKLRVFAVSGLKEKETTITRKIKTEVSNNKYKKTDIYITKEIEAYSLKEKEKADFEDSIYQYELELDDELEAFELDENDIEVKFQPKIGELNVDLSISDREAYESIDEFCVIILKVVKDVNLNSNVKEISITIHARDDAQKGKAMKFATNNLKEINWKKVNNLNNEDRSEVVDDLENGNIPDLSKYSTVNN